MIFQTVKKHVLIVIVLFTTNSMVHAQGLNIIPRPQKVIVGTGSFSLSGATKIIYDGGCKNEAVYFKNILKDEFKLTASVSERHGTSPDVAKSGIYLHIDPSKLAALGKEGYAIKADQSHVIVTGASAAGVFYGIQTIRQIIQNSSIPSVTIEDKPAFSWRGFLLDEGRYFKGEKVVKDLMDEMALLKMNVFHWHLTDDGGWRIEIKKYPKLTEIGSKRRMSETGTWLSGKYDSIPHSGFYTQAQIKRIIKYAADRHITIVPEIEMPGHASAAIASYPWLGAENKQIEVPISFGIKLDVFNVADPRVKQFIHDVLDEVMALFPSKVIHIGGDEVKFDQWKASSQVNAYMKEHHIQTPADLQIDFTNGISAYLDQHHHRMMGWNEILGGHNQNNDSTDAHASSKLASNAIIDFWTGSPKIVGEAVAKGYNVVNSYWWFTYLDYDYNTTTLERAYSFKAIPDSIPEKYHSKILGINTQMWGEWIPTVQRMNYLVYPRIAAMAEVGWTKPSQKDYRRFFDALVNGYLKKHWESEGIELSHEQLYGGDKAPKQ